MTPPHVILFGYPLDWWWTAVLIPTGLGTRWYLSYRQRSSQNLIQSQSRAIEQLSELNSILSAQLSCSQQRADAAQQRADAEAAAAAASKVALENLQRYIQLPKPPGAGETNGERHDDATGC